MDFTIILKYFPNLDNEQKEQFEKLFEVYIDWNQKINVVSRKDIDQLYLRHVLHSMSISKFVQFVPESHIIDLGAGGGFPGIPLAIMYPESKFTLIDSIGKKVKVIDEVVSCLGLENVRSIHGRAEEQKIKADFVVSRAVAKIIKLKHWSLHLISKKHRHAIPNGIIALKGGDLSEEVKELSKKDYYEIEPLSNYFDEEFFREKCILYLQR